MLYETILIPYDNSNCARAALLEAARFAEHDSETSLRIINIIDTERLAEARIAASKPDDPDPKYTVADLDRLYNKVIADADIELYSSIGTLLDGLQNEIIIELIEETLPGDQIVDYAKEHRCDLIIMGSRGLGGLESLLGSVSSQVLQSAPMPVMVVS